MPLELRGSTLDRLAEMLALPVDAVGVGQEGCPHRLPPDDQLRSAADQVRHSGRNFTLVLPQAWERFVDRVVDTAIRAAADGPVTLVANDMGTLVALSEASLPQHARLALGQGVVFGYQQAPLVDRWLESEVPELAEELRGANVSDDSTLGLLCELGVVAVETDAATASATRLPLRRNLAVRVVCDRALVGISRVCPTARYYGSSPANCRQICDRGLFRLRPTQRWRLADGHREPVSEAARDASASLLVSGNLVFRSLDHPPPASCDDIVIDVRWHPGPELAVAVAALLGRT